MIKDIIHKRRAVYPVMYNSTPIPKETIEQLLLAAHQAPTHKKTQPWRFKVMHSQESRERLGDFLGLKYRETISNYFESKEEKIRAKPRQAGCVIGICIQRDLQERVPYWEETAATAMAVQNMWLLCTEMGLGCYWSTPKLKAYMDEFFQLGEGEHCLGFFYIGNTDADWPEPWERNPLEQHVTWL